LERTPCGSKHSIDQQHRMEAMFLAGKRSEEWETWWNMTEDFGNQKIAQCKDGKLFQREEPQSLSLVNKNSQIILRIFVSMCVPICSQIGSFYLWVLKNSLQDKLIRYCAIRELTYFWPRGRNIYSFFFLWWNYIVLPHHQLISISSSLFWLLSTHSVPEIMLALEI
jgi:hypothetical protein